MSDQGKNQTTLCADPVERTKADPNRSYREDALVAKIEHLRLVMRECCDAIRDQDEIGALRMLEVALNAG